MSEARVHTAVRRESFEVAYARVAGSMHVLAAALVGRSDASDVVQEACIVGLRRYREFAAEGGNFQAWMATIIRHVASNHRRSERRRGLRIAFWSRSREHEVGGWGGGGAVGGGAGPGGADQSIDASLLAAVESLDEDERVCLLLRVVRGHSYREIGTTLSMPEATVRSHVFRARKRLLKELGDSHEVLHD